ncbi:MAG: UDP-N-acetylenolpyruvoylglucosamine reductase [Candidatus Omnitrophica bacterium CG11_big_fil_rev_8_21_14_0_20_64_10]|nr:MAG: UDP-N-acetylenolpyruvoylglucosamine reductase [Candidatus Omnitrophica bacterium CG11_big_fil_rev_8_21_14_0_20_64_10]
MPSSPSLELFGRVPGVRLRRDEPMSRHTTLRLGGPAELWAEPESDHALAELLRLAREERVPVTVIGGGANVLVRDEGIPGLTIHLGHRSFFQSRRTPAGLWAGAGLSLEWLIKAASEQGLAGLEFLTGVPGRVGGAVWMNAGTRDDAGRMRSMADVVESVQVMGRDGRQRYLSAEQMGFRYRGTGLRDEIILGAEFRLEPDDPDRIEQRIKALWDTKRRTQDWSAPSAGCMFKNPSSDRSAGWMIDQAGLKGVRVGGMQISPRHANFMIHVERATAADALALMETARQRVHRQFGIWLEPEIRILPPPALQGEGQP